MGFLLILAGVAAVGGLAYGMNRWIETKRRSTMTQFAVAHQFELDSFGQLHAMIRGFSLFSKGHSHELTSVMRAQRGDLMVAVGDFTYVTGSGKHRTVHKQTFCLAQKPNVKRATFFIRRESLILDKLGKVFGGKDINFEEDEAFSKAYVLQTEGSEDELRRSFGVPVRRQFLALKDKKIEAQSLGDALLMHRKKRLQEPEILELLADTINTARTWFL
jgi:hypothetical protein